MEELRDSPGGSKTLGTLENPWITDFPCASQELLPDPRAPPWLCPSKENLGRALVLPRMDTCAAGPGASARLAPGGDHQGQQQEPRGKCQQIPTSPGGRGLGKAFLPLPCVWFYTVGFGSSKGGN